MYLEISSSEAWKIIDAIKAYPENYHVSEPIQKMFKKIRKDIEKAIKDENLGIAPEKSVKKVAKKSVKKITKKATIRKKKT
jgi:sulfur relay (sulfurtransferase) DsrC/TusE family protein